MLETLLLIKEAVCLELVMSRALVPNLVSRELKLTSGIVEESQKQPRNNMARSMQQCHFIPI